MALVSFGDLSRFWQSHYVTSDIPVRLEPETLHLGMADCVDRNLACQERKYQQIVLITISKT